MNKAATSNIFGHLRILSDLYCVYQGEAPSCLSAVYFTARLASSHPLIIRVGRCGGGGDDKSATHKLCVRPYRRSYEIYRPRRRAGGKHLVMQAKLRKCFKPLRSSGPLGELLRDPHECMHTAMLRIPEKGRAGVGGKERKLGPQGVATRGVPDALRRIPISTRGHSSVLNIHLYVPHRNLLGVFKFTSSEEEEGCFPSRYSNFW